MSTPHRATPEQWALVEQYAEIDCHTDSVILELRDRLAAAEQRISELEGNSSAGLTGSNYPAKPDSSAPAGSLVEVVRDAIACEYDPKDHCWVEARAAILACALWLEQQNVGAGRAAARWLRDEVER
mgnify:CR=1 FL=1